MDNRSINTNLYTYAPHHLVPVTLLAHKRINGVTRNFSYSLEFGSGENVGTLDGIMRPVGTGSETKKKR